MVRVRARAVARAHLPLVGKLHQPGRDLLRTGRAGGTGTGKASKTAIDVPWPAECSTELRTIVVCLYFDGERSEPAKILKGEGCLPFFQVRFEQGGPSTAVAK